MTWAGRRLTAEQASPEADDPCACLELQAEASTVLATASSGDFDEAVLDALQRTCQRLGLGHAAVFRPEPETGSDQRLTHVLTRGEETVPPGPFRPGDRFPWCQARVAAGEVLVLHDVEDLPPVAEVDRASWRTWGITGELLYPMLDDRGDLLGTLVFGRSRDQPPFQTETVELLRRVSHVFATAIVRRESELERQRGCHRTELRLAASEHHFRLLAENASDIVWHVDADGRVVWVSPAVEEILGWAPEELLGTIGVELAHEDDLERARDARDRVVAGGTVHEHFRFRCADGGDRWVDVSERQLPEADGGGRVVAMRDIQATVEARAQLEHVIDHDTVTGLANLAGVLAEIEEQLGRSASSPRSLAVLGVRVDSLAAVNAAYTHPVGDIVLATLAHRIEDVVGTSGLVGRGTGAEFLVVLPDLREPASAAVTAELVRQAAKAPLVAAGHEVRSTVSIGIATGGPGCDPALLVRDAGLAMKQAKEDGRDRVAFFDPILAVEAERSVAVLADVRAGLLREELLAWYQPIVRLGRERVVGFEALVRWRRSDGRLLPPHEFLPIVERSAQVADLDLAVLAQAARALRSLPPDLFVSVNVSARTLTLVDYAGEIARVAREAGIDPVRLHVEVTETTLLSVSDVVDDAMRAVAATGATWYVDDFGTGYSSIAHLRDLPVSGLKLDLSFTAGIRRGDARSVSIAQGLVGMAQGLGLDTIAEGVETEQEGAVLAAQGWRHGQGWRYGRARPLEEWLAQERRPRAPGRRA